MTDWSGDPIGLRRAASGTGTVLHVNEGGRAICDWGLALGMFDDRVLTRAEVHARLHGVCRRCERSLG